MANTPTKLVESEVLTGRLARFAEVDIYPVISSEFTLGRHPLEVLLGVAAAGAKIVQTREKNLPAAERLEVARQFRQATSRFGMLLIVNDDVELALEVGADGVHLGLEDMSVDTARHLAPDLIIGASSHTTAEALAAESRGASYVNLGPIYATNTKQVPGGRVGARIIGETAPRLGIPFTVMGGIKEPHIPELLALGARKIAMVTEITGAPDVEAKTRRLRSYWENLKI